MVWAAWTRKSHIRLYSFRDYCSCRKDCTTALIRAEKRALLIEPADLSCFDRQFTNPDAQFSILSSFNSLLFYSFDQWKELYGQLHNVESSCARKKGLYKKVVHDARSVARKDAAVAHWQVERYAQADVQKDVELELERKVRADEQKDGQPEQLVRKDSGS